MRALRRGTAMHLTSTKLNTYELHHCRAVDRGLRGGQWRSGREAEADRGRNEKSRAAATEIVYRRYPIELWG